jgi:hypothetical protein
MGRKEREQKNTREKIKTPNDKVKQPQPVSFKAAIVPKKAHLVPHNPSLRTFRQRREVSYEAHLYLLQDNLLELALNLLAILTTARLAVQRQQSTQVELGLLQHLDLANVDLRKLLVGCTLPSDGVVGRVTHVLQGVDALGGLLNLAANDLRDQLGGQLLQGAAAGLALDDLGHLSPDGADLRGGGVGGLLDLVGAALGEADGEQAQQVVVGGLDRDVGLNQRLPLADERPQLVRGEVKAVEVGQAVLALHLVDPELDLAESVLLILLQISEGDLDDAALEGVVGVLQTGRAVDERLADTEGRLC